MSSKVIYTEGGYSIHRRNGLTDEARHVLENAPLGTEGVVYEHLNRDEHIEHLHNPVLLSIQEGDRILGTAVFCQTDVSVGTHVYNAYYVRYFAASGEIRGRGIMKHFSGKTMEAVRLGEREKTIYFASVERKNHRSFKVVSGAGYENLGVMRTNGFSRFFPRKSSSIERINTEQQRCEVLELLQEQYREHALVHFNSIFLHDDYYVIRHNGRIVAGCQFHRVKWAVRSMPGLTGKLIVGTTPYIPLLNRLFNPAAFNFLGFEGIYCEPGYENRLEELFEGLLWQEKRYSAMYWMAETCPVRQRIQSAIRPGLLHSFVQDAHTFIMASTTGLTEDEMADLRKRPLFASAFDYT
jgi:hypothetical protein